MSRNFIRSIAILSGSNLVAQLINFITYLLLPKYFYSPEDFGVFGLFLALYFVLFEVINLKMDQSIMLPDNETEAKGLLGFSWMVAWLLSGGILVVLLIFNSIFHWLDPLLPVFLAISLIMGGLIQPAMVYLNRQSQYLKMGNVRIAQAVVTLIGSIGGYYFFHHLVNGLILGFMLGQLVAVLLVTVLTSSDIHMAEKKVIMRYRQFIQYGSISSMISTLSRNLPAFVIKPLFGNAALGWYTLAIKYLNAPVGIFSSSVAQVYFKEASNAGPEELRVLTRKVVYNILAIAAIPSLLLLFFGGDLFGLVFGEEWSKAGEIIQVLIIWYFVAYASGPVSMLLDIKLKLDWELSYNLLLLIGRAAALLTVIWWKDVFVVLAVYAIVGVIFNCILLNYVLNLSKHNVESS